MGAAISRSFHLFLILFAFEVTIYAQNVINQSDPSQSLPAIEFNQQQIQALVKIPYPKTLNVDTQETKTVQNKLERHVSTFLQEGPWLPFYHTLGISGYEVYFTHPDEMVYALSLAYPFLTRSTQKKTAVFLSDLILHHPPYQKNGFVPNQGRHRERYQVPFDGRYQPQKADSLFGIYAYWAYTHFVNPSHPIAAQWEAICRRAEDMLQSEYPFTMQGAKEHDEAEKLNGDLAGLIGLYHLAKPQNDDRIENKTLAKLKELFQLRINLDRQNANILRPTHSASKHLHNFKLARYCGLTAEIGLAVQTHGNGIAARRLKSFREQRPTWYMAFGDRMIGGENYTTPLHFSRALFAAAAWIEQRPVEELFTFLDIPWCKGDLYFMEKCAIALMKANLE